jgi:hypothetical protein
MGKKGFSSWPQEESDSSVNSKMIVEESESVSSLQNTLPEIFFESFLAVHLRRRWELTFLLLE